jgi:apolipoprotein N-acyltransferase
MNRIANFAFVILAGLATAVLAYFGTGLHPLWPLLWLAPIPVLTIAPRLRAVAAFFLASIAWFIGGLNLWTYFTGVLEIPLLLVLVFLVIPAAIFGVGVIFTRSFLRRQAPVSAALAFPVFWVTWEYLNAITSLHGTFGNVAYSQMNFLPAIQIASITGIWGVTFITFFFASTVAVLLSGIGKSSVRTRLVVAVCVVLCSALLFGEWRLRSKSDAPTVKVTLIAKDVPISVYLGSEDKALQLLREYAAEISRVTPARTQVVVLPEKIARVTQAALPQVDALFFSAATATGAAVDVGLVRRNSSGGSNSSRLYSPDGRTVATYDKHHLLAGVEPERPGTKRVTVSQPDGRWALQICKDMDFPQLSRQYAGDRANLLLVPAWDFNADGWLHARMAVLRAVENGCALARCARNGRLTLADSHGHIIAEKTSAAGRFVNLSGDLPVPVARTFYTRAGDWFAWLCVAAFGALLMTGVVPNRRPGLSVSRQASPRS